MIMSSNNLTRVDICYYSYLMMNVRNILAETVAKKHYLKKIFKIFNQILKKIKYIFKRVICIMYL